jgi:toxin YoeB
LKKIADLIRSIEESPHQGLGKPEGLDHNLSGLWSRRINQKYSLVYEIEQGTLFTG